MRIAISTDGDSVSAHFGRCPTFTIVDIEEDKVTHTEVIDNPGHHPGFIPRFMHERGVSCMVTGGMGMRATSLFNDLGIRTIIGVSGRISDVVEKLRKGTLESGESQCTPGSGKGYGLDKTVCTHPGEDEHDDR